MEALAAVSLASNILQFVEFAGKLISQTKEIYQSADGTLNAYTVLEEAAENLTDLSRLLRDEDLVQRGGVSARVGDHNVAETQLARLRNESRDITTEILLAINKLKARSGNKTFRSIEQAFRSVWSERDMKTLEARLQSIRQQIDTALLFSLRERLSKLPENDNSAVRDGINQLSKDSQQRHIELLSAIANGGSPPTDPDNMAKLSQHVQDVAHYDSGVRFHRIVTARLRFAELPDRFESIPEAHKSTFSWVFQPPQSRSNGYPWTSFTGWLENNGGQNLYWIAGKPGSGKSTFMKYLYQDHRTLHYLKHWSGSAPLICSGFFFWNSGAVMQMSRLGLLQTLLHVALRRILQTGNEDLSYVKWLFQERWEQFEAFGGGRNVFTWPELRRVFERLLSDTTKRFMLFIDSLDEFDGDARELNQLIISASQRPNVKICTASRPWVVFEEAFEGRPSLLLEQLTNDDIHAYVTSRLEANKRYERLKHQDPVRSQALVQDITRKAAGVFLWVYLVVESLLQGIVNADRMSDLQVRLGALPSDLEALFDRLLRNMDRDYYRHGCQYFRMLNDHVYPPLLCLAFADDDDLRSGLNAKAEMLSAAELKDKAESTERRLKSRCMGLLEIYEPLQSDDGTDEGRAVHFRDSILDPGVDKVKKPAGIEELKVRYLHRTARDFLQSPPIWQRILEATGYDEFDSVARWANGFLWALKTSPSVGVRKTRGAVPARVKSQMSSHMWLLLTWCIEYALRMEKGCGRLQLTYLDEVARGAFHGRKTLYFPIPFYEKPVTTFVKMAVVFGLRTYVQVKIEEIPRDEASGIAELSQELSGSTLRPYQEVMLSGRELLKNSMRHRHLQADQIGIRDFALTRCFD